MHKSTGARQGNSSGLNLIRLILRALRRNVLAKGIHLHCVMGVPEVTKEREVKTQAKSAIQQAPTYLKKEIGP
jgi:hypothetical protein